eukprot:jgi/Psemu1/374/gm1.374_g
MSFHPLYLAVLPTRNMVAEGSPPFATTIGLSAEGAEELMAAPEYHSRQLMDGLDSLLVGVAGAMAMIAANRLPTASWERARPSKLLLPMISGIIASLAPASG